MKTIAILDLNSSRYGQTKLFRFIERVLFVREEIRGPAGQSLFARVYFQFSRVRLCVRAPSISKTRYDFIPDYQTYEQPQIPTSSLLFPCRISGWASSNENVRILIQESLHQPSITICVRREFSSENHPR